MIKQKQLRFLLLAFLTVFMFHMLMCTAGCRSIKHLTKTIDQSFAKKDSTGKNDSVIVSKDSSKYATEIVIDYDSAAFENKLLDGADADWDPFYPPQKFDSIMSRIDVVNGSKQPIKRITIRTNVQLHRSDSAAYHGQAKVNTETKTVAVSKKLDKKVFPWYYSLIAGLLILLIIYALYRKYRPKITALITKYL